MNPVVRMLMTATLLCVAPLSGAVAEDGVVQSGQAPCDAVCRLFRGLAAPAANRAAAGSSVGSTSGHNAGVAAATADKPTREVAAQDLGAITIATGADGAHEALAADIAAVLAPETTVKTVRGTSAPIRDMLTLPGVDLSFTSSLSVARSTSFAERAVYVAKLGTEELHAVAGADVGRLEDLAGKTVYLGPPQSDSETAARAVLEARGIAVTPASGTSAEALQALKAGRVAAVFVLAPKPFAPLRALTADDGLHLLPLAYREGDDGLYPAAFTADDYPGLIAQGARVEAVATDTMLIAPRWRDSSPRQTELTAFTARFFERLPALAGNGAHPKWQETNLAAGVDGFRRLKSAQQWVAARLQARKRQAGETRRGDRQMLGEAQ